MTTNINPDAIHRVLIAGCWYDVDWDTFDGRTFTSFETYEAAWVIHETKTTTTTAPAETWFSFICNGDRISGPVTSIQAVEQ